MEATTGEFQQLWSGMEIDLGPHDVIVAHVGGKPREPSVNVNACPVPGCQTVDSERVAKIVWSRSYTTAERLESQAAKHAADNA